jgi:hypothetical protein
MKHSSTRDLFRYWNDCRGREAAPERNDVDPTAIPRILADTFLLGPGDAAEMKFRLAGTRVCALFNRELRGAEIVPMFRAIDHRALRELIGIVGEEESPAVAGVTGTLANADDIDLEMLLLPLRQRGRGYRILGVIAPVKRPYWLGMQPVETLALDSFRYLQAGEPARPLSRSVTQPLATPAPQPVGKPRIPGALSPIGMGRPRRGLIVYDGGRA